MELHGYPLKIYNDRSLHLPRNLCRIYGFGKNVKLIRREIPGGFFFSPVLEKPLHFNETLILLNNELLHLPAHWLIQNYLIPGKSDLYLTATDQGFYLMISSDFSTGQLA